ncbi:MAG: dTDP-4-dehydrorhamnose 3,5-epimerase [Solirubrobacteraceae bacterium]|nr:dTDP-4-dehydrorhamnose 3,5-epimerase [Solirubrobacteraceae bacterium]
MATINPTALQAAVRDEQTVTPEGESVRPSIDGVAVRRGRTVVDERGTITEMLSATWAFTQEPIVYAYQTTIRPGVVKGWIVHLTSVDRLFFASGSARLVLFDAREDSATAGLVEELFFDPANRGVVRIPCGVFHAVQNIGVDDAVFVNFPTEPYAHEDPDKYRLPLDTESIPFRF